MTAVRTLSISFSLLFFCIFFSTTVSAQLHTKLQWMPDDDVWGIFVKADTTIEPSQDILLGSGQVTVVAPTGFEVADIQSYMGSWVLNARVNAPEENREKDYISFGIRLSEKISQFGEFEETLILTFSALNNECPTSLNLIELADPFVATTPNSMNTNPGNDLQLVDIGQGAAIYSYYGNYDIDSWDCNVVESLTTSLKEIKKREMIKVYPNPFVNQIIFEAKMEGKQPNLQVKITDNIGRLIHDQPMTTDQLQLEIQPQNGLYFYQVMDLDNMKIIESGKLFSKSQSK